MATQFPKKKKNPSGGKEPYPDLIFVDPSDPDTVLFRDNRFPDKVYHYSGYLNGETTEWVGGEDLKIPEAEVKPQEDWRARMRREHEEELERERKKTEEDERIRAEEERKERLRRQKQEEEKQKRQRIEEERLKQERLTQDRLEQERAERERLELERLKLEQQRLEEERLRRERLKQEELERERLKLERERLKLEQQRLEQERLEKERLENERLRQERLQRQRLKQQRLEDERFLKARLEYERLEEERLKEERFRREKLERERLENQRTEQQQLEKARLEQQRLERQRLEEEKLRQARLEQLELENQRLRQERLEQERLEQAIREQAKQDQRVARMEVPNESITKWKFSETAQSPRNAWLERAKAVASGLLDGINPKSDLISPVNASDVDEEITASTPHQETLTPDLLALLQEDQTQVSEDVTSPGPSLLKPIDNLSNPLNDIPKSASSSAFAAKFDEKQIGLAPKEPHFRVPYVSSTCEETLYSTDHDTAALPGLSPPPHLLTPELSICWFLLFLFLFPRILIPQPLRQLTMRKVTISAHNQKSWRYVQNLLRATVALWMVYMGYMCSLEWWRGKEVAIWWDDSAPRVWYCGCESWPVFKPLEVLGWCERRV